jgi:hypothetical protein
MAFLIRDGKLLEREARKKEGDGESAIVVKHSSAVVYLQELPLFDLKSAQQGASRRNQRSLVAVSIVLRCSLRSGWTP